MTVPLHSLTAAQRQAYEDALVGPGVIQQRWHFEIWSSDFKFLAHVKWQPEDGPEGQIDLDISGTPTRSASLFIPTPGHYLGVGHDGAWVKRILRIEHWQWVDGSGIDDFVACPVFTGPITKADTIDDGNGLDVAAAGLEQWCKGAIKGSHVWRKGAKVTDALRFILRQAGVPAGRIDVPDLPDRFGRPFGLFGSLASQRKHPHVVAPELEKWWGAAKYLATRLNRDLYADGAGIFRLRKRGSSALYAWRLDRDILSWPQWSSLVGGAPLETDQVINDTLVIGQYVPPKKKQAADGGGSSKPKTPPTISGEWIVPAGNSLSPQNMGFHGTPLYLQQVVQNAHISTDAQAKALAKTLGERALTQARTLSFDSPTIPFVDEWMPARAAGKRFFVTQATWTFAPQGDAPMSLCYKRLTPWTLRSNHA